MRHFKHLTYNDRLKIESWLRVNVSVKDIAVFLGVNVSTIYREIKRGRYNRLNGDTYECVNSYSPDIADCKYRYNLAAKSPDLKIHDDFEFSNFVENKIVNDKYSPAAVLGEIEDKNLKFKTKVCVSTLYNYISKGVFSVLSDNHLPVKSKRKKAALSRKAAKCCAGTSIEKRPDEILQRTCFGHWEMDLVCGKKERGKVLLVFSERYSRFEIIKLIDDKTTTSVVKAINGIERKLGKIRFRQLFKSITVDNGSEFQDFEGIEHSTNGIQRTKVYYCHPYSSWERGTNENQNRLIRRHYPKGTSFNNLKQSDVDKLQNWINNYPRKLFSWSNSNAVFQACLNSI
ncbi:MAG: IS30 family transposase [Ruminococcus sp.]|nr:IS30 family transposase [Ruminococcus sp.]